ncbi:hypothetical protein [Thiopseudomonas alkaliphila]|uniref:hypothetical protein n=1 Tax=Thiopseudomonas alkaliphila TaxID=1697053 RepID=UPI002577B280|nr:hypothetical protein [Thiopseudomonas alkaliphila]MDM1707280.1 hypothetical protein [Thiopseudomonas alkaliphila]
MFRLSNRTFYILAFFILMLKILIYIYLKSSSEGLGLGGGSDAGYYHAYATGVANNAVNFWPVILRFMYSIGLYNREVISTVLFLMTVTLIPYVLYKIIVCGGFGKKLKLFLYVYFLVSVYPTLYLFALDIYRDVFMVMILLISWFFLKRYYNDSSARFFNLTLFFVLGYLCFLLRPYLGFAVIAAFFLYNFYTKTSKYAWLWVAMYALFLMVFQGLGFFSVLTEYRGVDGFTEGGSTLGISLDGRSPVVFLGLFIVSFLAQVFGFFLVNTYAVILFIVESIPFLLALRYIFKNKIYMNRFCHYLLAFFIIYTTVWVIGNDNLGTAVRLRFHSYMAIFICFFIVYQNKLIHKRYSH